MPNPLNAALPVAETDIERRKREAAQDSEFSLLGAAYSNTLPAIAVEHAARRNMAIDNGFFLTKEKVLELGDGIDPSMWDLFADAGSEDEANLIRMQLLDRQAAMDRLAAAGAGGTIVQGIAALTDPAYLGLAAATGSLGSFAASAGSTGRVAMLGRAGIIGGAPAVIAEGYRASQDPRVTGFDVASAAVGGIGQGLAAQAFAGSTRTARFFAGGAGASAGLPIDSIHAAVSDEYGVGDVLFSLATNFALGGIGNALPGNQDLATAAERVIRNVQYEDVKKAAAQAGTDISLTPKGSEYFRNQTNDGPPPDIVDVEFTITRDDRALPSPPPKELPPGTDPAPPAQEQPPSGPDVAMGAASPNDPAFDPDAAKPAQKVAGDLDLSGASAAKAISGWSWLGPVGKYILEPIGVRVGQSIVPTFRRISAMLAKDVIPREGNTPSILSAPEWIESQTSRYLGDVHSAFDKGYRAHKEANGKNALSFEDFRNEVAKARRRQGNHNDPTVAATAKAISPVVKDLLGLQQRHGVVGAGFVDDNEWYTPRFWHRGKIDAMIERIGYDGVLEGLQKSIASQNPDLRPAVVKAMAEATIRNGGTNNTSFDAERALLWEEAGPRQLAAFLRQYAPDITDDEIIKAIGALKEAGSEKATPTQLRRKIRMDETGRYTVTDKNGNQVDFGVEDLLENDSMFLLTKYAHKSVRSSGMAEVYRAASVGLNKPVKSIPELLALLREEAASDPKNVLSNGKLTDQLEDDLALIERMAKLTAGIPVSESIKAASVGRTIRNLNFIKSMSSPLTGIRNFAELAMGVSNAGLDATFRVMPQIPKIIAQIKSGDMSSQLRQELHALGLGLDRVAHKLVNGTVLEEPTTVDRLSKAEKVSARGARAAADISLQSFGTVLMNEINGRLILQKWAHIARSGRMLSDKRLAGLGLDRAMADRVTAMLKEHAVFDKGTLVELNTHQWSDVEAATAMKAAVTKESTRIIQKNTATEYAPWMTKEMGKLVMQLRTFNYGAHRGKLLYEVRMADWETFKNIASYTAVGSVVYAFTTYLDSIGREDQQEFLDKRLSAKSMALATFARSSYSAMLPTFIDAALESTGNDPAFGFQRTTGLPSAALFGNPTWDWANAASKLPAIVTAPFRDDYDFSKQDVENMKKGLWIPNFPPLVRIIEQLTKNLPDRSKQ